mmetsp:Transcript_15238/g.36744  ORF Transcript_15238/g.36744 Transcript_15238/m.36744 type:complete len:1009 (-) Transcript_15238:231-3257(-)
MGKKGAKKAGGAKQDDIGDIPDDLLQVEAPAEEFGSKKKGKKDKDKAAPAADAAPAPSAAEAKEEEKPAFSPPDRVDPPKDEPYVFETKLGAAARLKKKGKAAAPESGPAAAAEQPSGSGDAGEDAEGDEGEGDGKKLSKGQLKKLKEKQKAAKAAEEGGAPAGEAAEEADEDAGEDGGDGEDGEDDGKEDLSTIDKSKLTKAQLKRLKEKEKKQKEKEKKAEKEAAAAEKKKGGGKIDKIKAEIAERQRLQAEKEEFERQEKLRIEQEIAAEKAAKEAEERIKEERRAARQARKEELKAQGLYVSRAERERRARAAEARQQLVDAGLVDLDAARSGEQVVVKSRAKKKKPKAEEEEEEEQQEEPQEAEEQEESDDDWEKLADDKTKGDDKVEEADTDDEESDESESEEDHFRSPICCILGHVDTGKTLLLDKIRRTNVQANEAGGITQQIGATFFPHENLLTQTQKVDDDFDLEIPGMLIIDTPGHESFNNLRQRGSSLCDISILVVDIMHGLEAQTRESINLLKRRRCPFVIALNKCDRLFEWEKEDWAPMKKQLYNQADHIQAEFHKRWGEIRVQLNELGLNVELYWELEDPRTTISVIPTSAMTGEGIPDLLYNIAYITQKFMDEQITFDKELQCTILEVKEMPGMGTTIDVVLVNGTLREGDTIVCCGSNGEAISTQIRALLTPQPMKELRVKGEYQHHKKIDGAMGVKIVARELSNAMAGTSLLLYEDGDDLEELKETVMEDLDDVCENLGQLSDEGVYIKASTLGALEALQKFMDDSDIPVFKRGIGVVNRKDVKRACLMLEKGRKDVACILAFNVKIAESARAEADKAGLNIFTAEIIYHLFDSFTAHRKKVLEERKAESRRLAVFPAILEIIPQYIFNKKDPIVMGVKVLEGQLRKDTPLCVIKGPIDQGGIVDLGIVAGIEHNKKAVDIGKKGMEVCVRILPRSNNIVMFGRHFEASDKVLSLISRESIDALKEAFQDEMKKEHWITVIKLKEKFQIA